MSSDRVVLITGCSRGIGLAAALAFAQRGDRVVATMRNLDASTELRGRLTEAGVDADIVALDITDDASVSDAFSATIERHGRIDVLVNNAGTGYRGTLEELSIADLQSSLDVNFLGAARTMKAALPAMRARGRGHIINMSSVAGAFGQPFNDAYCAAKFALEGLCESLHPIARSFGVHITVIEPGAVIGEFAARAEGAPPPKAGSPFAAMRAAYDAVMVGAAAGAASADDIAASIVATADDPEPRPRVQVPESTARLMAVKLKDLSGERVTQLTTKWLS